MGVSLGLFSDEYDFVVAILTQTIENRTHRIKFKTVSGMKVILDTEKFFTMHMDQFPALFTFSMETSILLIMNSLSHILKAGRRVGIDDVLVDDPFFNKCIKLPVYRRLAYRRSLLLKIVADISRGYVFPFVGREKIDQH